MREILPFLAVSGVLIALIVGLLGYFVDKGTKKAISTVKTDAEALKTTLSDVKATVNHVDLEYIKKILIRVTDHEQTMKKQANDLDLLDEKLKSFMNRHNARFPRPRGNPQEETPSKPDDQTDILEQLKASGHALPLLPQKPQQTQTRFVRSSIARRQA